MSRFIASISLMMFLGGCASLPKVTYLPTAQEINAELISSLSDNNIQSVELLKNQQFGLLVAHYTKLEISFNQDISNEKLLFWNIGSIAAASIYDSSIAEKLDMFVAQYPDSHIPYIYRANYFIDEGWRKRGGNFIEDTSQEKISGLKHYHKLAYNDLVAANKINSDNYVIHVLTGHTHYAFKGMADEAELKFLSAQKLKPAGYEARVMQLHIARPRWGGSLEKIENLTKDALAYSGDNERLNDLNGFLYQELGDQALFNNDARTAIQLYQQSLKKGNYTRAHSQLAYVYAKYRIHLKCHQHAIKHLKLVPYDRDSIYRKLYCKENLTN